MSFASPLQALGLRSRKQLPVPIPFQSLSTSISTCANDLPTLIDALSLPSNYSLSNPETIRRLKIALWSFALSPIADDGSQPYTNANLFFRDGQVPNLDSITSDFSIASLQGANDGEYSENRRGKVCGHIFKPGESVYRCRDCTSDATCVLCSKCFNGSNHSRDKHDVTLAVHSGSSGCCDCGDSEGFREGCLGDCRYHGVREGNLEEEKIDSEEISAVKKDVEGNLKILLDWMISVLESSPAEFAGPKNSQEIINLTPTPGGHQPVPPSPPQADATSTDPFSFFTPPSYTSSTARGKARDTSEVLATTTRFAGPWSVILWNDEKHSFTQVIDQVCRATGVTKREASDVANRVDTYGRDVIYQSHDTLQLLIVVKHISNIDLAVTVRPSIECYYEQVAGFLVDYMKELVEVQVGGEVGVLAEVLSKVLLERSGMKGLSRFQRLLGVDSKLWKMVRTGLAELYVTLLGVSKQVKTNLSVQFAQIYSSIAEAYLLTDREPENSIMTLSVQVFTVPSVSAYLVSDHGFLSGIIAVLYSFFTEQLAQPEGKHLLLPPNPSINRIDPESLAFKQKRYFQIFNDLEHLISSPAVQKLIRSNPISLDDFAAFLDLFTSMNPNKRAISEHVEYESDTWVTAFNVTIQLGKACKSFGEAYRVASPAELSTGLSTLLVRMAGPRTKFHNVEFGGVIYQLLDFRVENEEVSFHHPLGWLFSEMVKNIEALDSKALESIGLSSLSEIALGRAGQLHFLAAMDHPLRVIVLVAQIRAGLWVRNGFGMRAQQLHYKEYSLRENTFDQDIFFLQTALVILDPSLIIIAILDRFHVQDWLGGDDSHPTYEPLQAFAMVEEMLYLLIVLLSDPTNVTGLSDAACLRRELVHNLCLGPTSYSDLMRKISEKFTDDPQLDSILSEISVFKSPIGISDQGVYTLKEECYVEVNPYFSRYSRNQREEADKIVREYYKKASIGGEDRVIEPKPLNVTSGPFINLSAGFNSDVLLQIIFFSMQYGRARGNLFSEAMVDSALHLSMLAIIEQPISFANFAAERVLSNVVGESTLVQLMIKIEEDERMVGLRHKVKWCLDRLEKIVGPAINGLRKVEDTASPAAALNAKRLAAKARQAAILKQFAAAQQSFLAGSENIDEESDEEMGEEVKKSSLGSCIVCQDGLDSQKPFGLLGLIQTSSLIRLTPQFGPNEEFKKDYVNEVFASPSSLDRDATSVRPFGIASKKIPLDSDDSKGDGLSEGFPQLTIDGLHSSSCGHLMHLSCFETYYRSIEGRHLNQPTRCHAENVDRREFICPLCKSLGNVLLPVLPDDVEDAADSEEVLDARNLDDWYRDALDAPTFFARDDDLPSITVERMKVGSQLSRRHNTGGGYSVNLLSDVTGFASWAITEEVVTSNEDAFQEGEALMVSRMLEVSHSLLQEIGRGGNLHTPGYLPSELIGYTIACMEIASRGMADVSVASALPESSIRMLRSYSTVLRNLVRIHTGDEERSSEIAAHAVFSHLGGAFAKVETQNLSAIQPLTTLIEISAILPAAFGHVVNLCFYTELLKSFYGITSMVNNRTGFTVLENDPISSEYLALAQIKHLCIWPEDRAAPLILLNDLALGKLLYSYTLPFLRRAAIVERVLFGGTDSPYHSTSTGSEFSRLLNKLGILDPSLGLVTSEEMVMDGRRAIQSHIQACRRAIPYFSPNPTETISLQFSVSNDYIEHPIIYELIGLPTQLDTLVAESLNRKCERCGKVPTEPALCLLCGEMVCNQSFCCMDGAEEAQHGECNSHMWTCGGSTGMYYLIKRNSILYLYTDRGTFLIPPYLDSHGEVDLGNRNRNQFPQYLHSSRYDEIRKTWLNHGIPTFVARKLEASVDHGGWQTM